MSCWLGTATAAQPGHRTASSHTLPHLPTSLPSFLTYHHPSTYYFWGWEASFISYKRTTIFYFSLTADLRSADCSTRNARQAPRAAPTAGRHIPRPRSPAALGALVNRSARSRPGWKRRHRPAALPSSGAGASRAPQPTDRGTRCAGPKPTRPEATDEATPHLRSSRRLSLRMRTAQPPATTPEPRRSWRGGRGHVASGPAGRPPRMRGADVSAAVSAASAWALWGEHGSLPWGGGRLLGSALADEAACGALLRQGRERAGGERWRPLARSLRGARADLVSAQLSARRPRCACEGERPRAAPSSAPRGPAVLTSCRASGRALRLGGARPRGGGGGRRPCACTCVCVCVWVRPPAAGTQLFVSVGLINAWLRMPGQRRVRAAGFTVRKKWCLRLHRGGWQ